MNEYIIKDMEKIFKQKDIPFPPLKIEKNDSDRYVTWKSNSRLDLIANEYYSNPLADYLILIANKNIGIDENEWGNDIIIRVPYPYESALNRLTSNYDLFKKINLNET